MRKKLAAFVFTALPAVQTDGHPSVRLAKSPKLVRFVLSLMAVFAVLGALPDRSFGQGLTCGWCYEMSLRGSLVHWFPRGGSECGWPNPGAGYVCARCGGKSHCHGYHSPHRWGPCHILCGGQTTQKALSNAVSDLRSGMDIMDLDRVAEAIAATRDGVWVEYLPEAGRIDLVLACAPSIPARTVPVPPEIRPALGRALMDPVIIASLSGRSRDAWRKQALK